MVFSFCAMAQKGVKKVRVGENCVLCEDTMCRRSHAVTRQNLKGNKGKKLKCRLWYPLIDWLFIGKSICFLLFILILPI